MTYLDWQLEQFDRGADRPALAWRDRDVSYAALRARFDDCVARLDAAGVSPGDSVAVVGDFSPASVAWLLALVRRNCVLIPLALSSREQHAEFQRIAECDHVIEIDAEDTATVRPIGFRRDHSLLDRLRKAGEPGLVLFSSGSTGEPKAILHAVPRLLEKFRTPRNCHRTLGFLLFDHIGGFNTLFYTLANLGCLIIPEDRTVAAVCRAVERHRVSLLPTSPSFLNLLLLAGAHKQHDLSSLKLVTYGTEVMPERTLALMNEALPGVTFQQTYGLSELGILRSKSAANDSLFVKVGGEGYETKVVDGTLRIRGQSSMLGYLNAPDPFDADGWFNTGDAVVVEGDYYRILGRRSEVINVGGQKVYPAEVEKVVAELADVIDVAVSGEQHLLLGQIVVATVQTAAAMPSLAMKQRIVEACKGRLQPYMVPAKVRTTTEPLVNHRFKKVRR